VSGKDFKVGGKVLVEGVEARVVFNTITMEFSPEYPRDLWQRHELGVMVEGENGACIFFPIEALESGVYCGLAHFP